MSPWRLRQIARQITQGAIIAYPTDTIWGLGCHPLLQQSVLEIQRIKRRSTRKALILLASQLEQLLPYIEPDNRHLHLLSIPSPTVRPVTWLVKASKHCPHWLTGNSDKVAVRLTDRCQIDLLCKAMQAPLVSTSANISGRKTIRNILQAHKHFQPSVDYIIEGFATAKTQASEIRDLQTGKIIRS